MSAEYKLHPLVLCNVSDHSTRVSYGACPDSGGRAVGILLGVHRGRAVEICNSFELQYVAKDDNTLVVNQEFMMLRAEQYKKTFSEYEILGWYSTGSIVRDSDVELHKTVFTALNESPVYMLLDPTVDPTRKSLPVTLYEAELRVGESGGEPFTALVQCPYSIETVEAERIAVDQATKITATGETHVSQVTQHLDGMHSAVKMLHNRVSALRSLLARMESGEIPVDHGICRKVNALIRRLPAMDSDSFKQDFLREYNDGLLVVYLANITKGVSITHEMIDRVNTLVADDYKRLKIPSGRGGRGGGTQWGVGGPPL